MSRHLCDVNVWLALSLEQHAARPKAAKWLESVDEPASILFCRSTQQSFLRVLTSVSIMAPYGYSALTNGEAWAAFESFMDDDRIAFQADEPLGIERLWEDFATRRIPSPKLWMDAYLGAFAVAAGLTLVTADQGTRSRPTTKRTPPTTRRVRPRSPMSPC